MKAALLDQKNVAGLGNIYVCEALFGAGLSPRRIAATVTGARADRLVAAIKRVLARAIEAGGSSLRDYVQTSASWDIFSTNGRSMGAKANPAPAAVAAAPSSGSSSRTDRLSIAPDASGDANPGSRSEE